MFSWFCATRHILLSFFNYIRISFSLDVIKAWDLGVLSMLKGEVAVLYCKPEYSYGEAGHPPKIPPNSTLVCTLKLTRH